MRAEVDLKVTMLEVEIIRKALANYIGKIDHIERSFDVGFDELQNLKKERDLTIAMLRNLR